MNQDVFIYSMENDKLITTIHVFIEVGSDMVDTLSEMGEAVVRWCSRNGYSYDDDITWSDTNH